MSLAADTARTASNMNKALTLDFFISVLERTPDRYVSPATLLEMLHEHLNDLERIRLQFANDERVKTELNGQLQEVMT